MSVDEPSQARLAEAAPSWRAGMARRDITAFEPGATTVAGWARPQLRLRGVASPIYARALVLRRAELVVVFACVELCFVSAALREAICDRLERDRPGRGLAGPGLVLSATHSHGSPDGVVPHLAYAAANQGFSPWVFDAVVEGVVEAIVAADERCEPACLRFAQVEIPGHERVAFNRSLAAFARNLDAPTIPPSCPELATVRTSSTLRIDDLDGRALGLVNWFGVHGTCVAGEAEQVHGDNKGLAAALVERELGGVAIFAQEAAGDVSPNYRWDEDRGRLASAFEDDCDGARHNAEIQARYALAAHAKAAELAPLPAGRERARLDHVDMLAVEVDPTLVLAQTGRDEPARCTPPVIGVGVVAGTDEGPGPLHASADLLATLARGRRARRGQPEPERDAKLPFLHTSGGVSEGRFLGRLPLRPSLGLFAPLEAGVAFVRRLDTAGLADEPLVPECLPLQLVDLGALVIVALPFEPTTMAGERLRATIRAAAGRPELAVVINGYANDYASYLSTFEEYGAQAYEGAATLFGPWTLAACRTALAAMFAGRDFAGRVDRAPRFDRARAELQRGLGPHAARASAAVARRPGPIVDPPLAVGRDGAFHPRDEAEVQALVRYARARGCGVRVVGARHSIAAAIHADDRRPAIELRLDHLDRVEFDEDRMQVEVGAGCHFGLDPRDPLGRSRASRSLCAQLEARGWALACLGGISHQTLAGFLATGSAGGSLRWSLADQVVGLQLVDGRGELRELVRGRDLEFEAALVSLGLLGVVTRIRLQCEPSYELVCREQTYARADAPFELDAAGPTGLIATLAAHDYARVLWWPQPGVDRLVVWTGDRRRPGRAAAQPCAPRYEALPRVLGSRAPAQAAAGKALELVAKLGGVRERAERPGPVREARERGLSLLYRAFVPLGPGREHRQPWHRALPLDDQIDERWMPVCFSEIWLAADQAAEALARLAALFEREGYAASQNFVCELYPAKASSAWLHPGHGRDSLRINLFWLETLDPELGQRWFARIHAALAGLDLRLHWGKHLAREPATVRAIARSYPRRPDFLALRRRYDPDDLFLTAHWRRHLELDDPAIPTPAPTPTPTPTPTLGSTPRLFHLDDPAVATAAGRTHQIVARGFVAAEPERVLALLADRSSWPTWVPGLRCVTVLDDERVELIWPRLRARVELESESESGGQIRARVTGLSRPLVTAAALELELSACASSHCELVARLDLQPPAKLDRWPLPSLTGRAVERQLSAAIARLGRELERRAFVDARPPLSSRLEPRPPSSPLVPVPPLFRMQPAGVEFLHHAREHLRASRRIPAPPERVDRALTQLEGAPRWFPGFLGVRWLGELRHGPGAVFDEHFAFMTLRVRTLEHEPGRRWLAVCEGCSLPLATRMVEEIHFAALDDGQTLLDWHIAFDPSALFRPAAGPVTARFEAWMDRSVDQLAHHFAVSGRASTDPA